MISRAFSGVLCIVFVVSLIAGMANAEPVSDVSYARLGRGLIGQFSWAVWVQGSARSRAETGHPCIEILTEEPSAARTVKVSETYECGRVTPQLSLTQSVSNGARGQKRRTVLAMAFVSSARQLVVDLGPLGSRTIKLRRLSASKAKQIGISAIAYWVHAFAGPFCLHKFSVYDGAGELINDSGPIACR